MALIRVANSNCWSRNDIGMCLNPILYNSGHPGHRATWCEIMEDVICIRIARFQLYAINRYIALLIYQNGYTSSSQSKVPRGVSVCIGFVNPKIMYFSRDIEAFTSGNIMYSIQTYLIIVEY